MDLGLSGHAVAALDGAAHQAEDYFWHVGVGWVRFERDSVEVVVVYVKSGGCVGSTEFGRGIGFAARER